MTINPVLRRELTERWRGRRAVTTLSAYLGVLGVVMWLLYRLGVGILASRFGFGAVDVFAAGPALGRFLLEGLLFFVLLLVLFVAPGYAAAQLSGERERRTLTLLQVTLLRPWQIVIGKLGASVAWLTLLVAAALPLGAAAFFLGGIALSDLLRGVFAILVIAVSVAGIALGLSSLTRRTTASVVLTYGVVLALTGGTLFVAAVEAVARVNTGRPVRTPVALYLNPFFGLADAVNAGGGFDAFNFGGGLPSPLGVLGQALPNSPAMRGFEEPMIVEDVAVAVPPEPGFVEGRPVPMPAVPAPIEPVPQRPEREPVWLQVLGLHAVMGLLGLVVATRRVRTGRARPQRAPRAASEPVVAEVQP